MLLSITSENTVIHHLFSAGLACGVLFESRLTSFLSEHTPSLFLATLLKRLWSLQIQGPMVHLSYGNVNVKSIYNPGHTEFSIKALKTDPFREGMYVV